MPTGLEQIQLVVADPILVTKADEDAEVARSALEHVHTAWMIRRSSSSF